MTSASSLTHIGDLSANVQYGDLWISFVGEMKIESHPRIAARAWYSNTQTSTLCSTHRASLLASPRVDH